MTVTIASFNSREVTRRALRSVFEHTTDLSFEVIVVDNASSDGTAAMIAEEFSPVNVVRSSRNLGFAAAHNLALQKSCGDYLLVLNSDVEFVNDAPKAMLNTITSWHGKAGAVGPRIINPDGSFSSSASYRQFSPRILVSLAFLNMFFPIKQYLASRLVRSCLGTWIDRVQGEVQDQTAAEKVEWVDGMCVLFDRRALAVTGLFDEQFFFDQEIGDLLFRIKRAGWDVIYDAQATAMHMGGYSRALNPDIAIHSIYSHLAYNAKYRPADVPFIKANLGLLLFAKTIAMRLGLNSSGSAQRYDRMRQIVSSFSDNDATLNESIPSLSSNRDARTNKPDFHQTS